MIKEIIKNIPLVDWFNYTTKFVLNYFNYRTSNIKISFNAKVIKCQMEGYNRIGNSVKLNNVKIGKYSYIADNTIAYNCEIGKFSSIGPDVRLGLGMHSTNMVSTSPVFYSKNNPVGVSYISNDNLDYIENEKVLVGSDVWIGAGVKILDGVTIGDGAIIGACSFVNKDVPPYAIVGGLPGKIIKYRYTSEIIDTLIQIRWWERDDEWIRKNCSFFTNINKFIEYAEY